MAALTYQQIKDKKNRDELSPELEQEAQQIEILLSNDFESMDLDQLNHVKAELDQLWGLQTKTRETQEVIYLTDPQVKQRDYLWYRIDQEEHKNDKVKIGDLFYTHWGYDQTNTEMYKVTGFTKSGKSAIVRQIGMSTKPKSEGFMCDQVIPDPTYEIKGRVWDEEKKCNVEQAEHLPDLRVKISRSSHWNPRTRTHDEIGKIHLRGSVYYAGDSKHLQNLYPIEKGDATYRSWYA